MTSENPHILLTGATGYVGGRLLRVLEQNHRRVRCLARRPEVLRSRVAPTTEVVQGDLDDSGSLGEVVRGIDTAYYLAHALGSGANFEEQEQLAAKNFAAAAREAGVKRIIYLGGLGRDDTDLSAHLRSRHEVGRILTESGAQVIEFRASIVIGSGSLSFEMIRALVRRLPVMITPRWVRVPAQPISINDVIAYLTAALDLPLESDSKNVIYEIGGADQVSYGDLMRECAHQRGLRRYIIPVPVLTTYLSSLWLHLVTPLLATVGRKLIDSIVHASVVNDTSSLEDFDIVPMGVKEAISQAFSNEDQEVAETRWADAYSSLEHRSWGGAIFHNRLVDTRAAFVKATTDQAFAPIERIGGNTGWYYGNVLWRLRGMLDVLMGGPGMGRGRRDPMRLRTGDVLDCWRVEAVDPPHRLRLAAEMKMPGRAWLEFEVTPEASGSSIRQTAIFDPVGWLGLAYWYAVYPLHAIVFRGMLSNLARAVTTSPNNTSEH
ncbi:MAG: DUF2867 domain-containing protein [Candidatus Hydrogenedentes bacterium]|nr:DUF2867 domain-containing protein [Candidatus Hydrogenedentota bacterium]